MLVTFSVIELRKRHAHRRQWPLTSAVPPLGRALARTVVEFMTLKVTNIAALIG